jgi:hypothetical protein
MSLQPNPWEEGFDMDVWYAEVAGRDEIYLSSVIELHSEMLSRIRELEAEVKRRASCSLPGCPVKYSK